MKIEIENIITFLEENEQYGDDWKNEIAVLKKILKELDIGEGWIQYG